MIKLMRILGIVCLMLALLVPMGATANPSIPTQDTIKKEAIPEFDQLIPQSFAFDKDNGIFAVISSVDNTVDVIQYTSKGMKVIKKVLVDTFEGRHDVYHIYRPQGVAIYEENVVFLASHRDSCYIAVLDFQGEVLNKYYFKGNASAFSYSPSKKELCIAGNNELGYDLMVMETTNGLKNSKPSDESSLHYLKPKKSEEVLIRDPKGGGMAIIAMSVVFVSLLILSSVFSIYGKILVWLQNLRATIFSKKKTLETGVEINVVKTGEVSGEAYAAIAAAIFLFEGELHDEETARITIKQISRSWTPWNAKYYGMNQYFNKR